MHPMLRWITAGLTALCLVLAACVTINVYFPAAAAEKAADRIIEDIWGPEKGPKPTGNEQSSLGPRPATCWSRRFAARSTSSSRPQKRRRISTYRAPRSAR